MFTYNNNILHENGVYICFYVEGSEQRPCAISIRDCIHIVIEGNSLYLICYGVRKYYGPNIFDDHRLLVNQVHIDEQHKLYQLCVDMRNHVKRILMAVEFGFNHTYSYVEKGKLLYRPCIKIRKNDLQIDILYSDRSITFNIDSDFLERFATYNEIISSLLHQFSDIVTSYRVPNKSARNTN